MKKIFFTRWQIFLILLFIPLIAFADDCSNAYMEGVRLYKSGKYVEAELKFIAVAKECGNYADVFKMLRYCNIKLSESLNESMKEQKRQAMQINNLKNENQQLVFVQKKLDADLKTKTDFIGQLCGKLLTTQSDLRTIQDALNVANALIEQLKSDTSNLHMEFADCVSQCDSLKTALAECELDTVANNVDIKVLKGNLKNAEKENVKLQQEKAEIEEKNENLLKKISALKEENDALKHPVKQSDKK